MTEYDRRRKKLRKLFALFGDDDLARAGLYTEMTSAVPYRTLLYALRSVVESHVWQRVPTVGEIVQAARLIAGMDREQYDSGRYVPAPSEWPPDGYRYGSSPGAVELLWVESLTRIAAAKTQKLLTEGEAHEGE